MGASGPGIEPFTAIRQGKWKLIFFHDGKRYELYNLEKDIGETNDVKRLQPLTFMEMRKHVAQLGNQPRSATINFD